MIYKREKVRGWIYISERGKVNSDGGGHYGGGRPTPRPKPKEKPEHLPKELFEL